MTSFICYTRRTYHSKIGGQRWASFLPDNSTFEDFRDPILEVGAVLGTPGDLLPVNVDGPLLEAAGHDLEAPEVGLRTMVGNL